MDLDTDIGLDGLVSKSCTGSYEGMKQNEIQ